MVSPYYSFYFTGEYAEFTELMEVTFSEFLIRIIDLFIS